MNHRISSTIASPEEWGIGEEDVRQRKAFLEFTEEDEEVLRALHTLLEPARHEFAGRFYEHLSQFPEARTHILDETMLARLKVVQSRYFQELTSGRYDRAYVENRLRVGLAHHWIGLETKWYIGSYAKYLNELLHLLWPLLDGDPERFLRTYSAVLKIVCFDIGLALESYHQMGLREIAAHKSYAAHLFERMTAGMAVLDCDGVVHSVNSAMAAILSLPKPEAAVGLPLSQLLSNDEVNRVINEMRTSDIDRDRVVAKATHTKSATRHLEVNIEKVHLDEQLLFVLFVQDITDRMTAEARLRASEERFRMTFNLAAVGLAHVDASARILRVNEKLCEILGHHPDELLEEDIRRQLHPEDVGGIIRGAQRLFQGETNHRLNVLCTHAPTAPAWLASTSSSL